jgi:putative transposase
MAITDPLDHPRYRPTIPIDRPHSALSTLTLVDANNQIMHVFWQTHYHLVWVTKNRSPLITPQDETFLYPYIKGKADTIGCIIHAIGGIHDHIHLIISIPPALAIADVVKRLKGSSSHALNHHPDRESNRFSWQEGYGVLTLGRKQLPRAIAYVTHQKQHHQAQTLIPILEPTSPTTTNP